MISTKLCKPRQQIFRRRKNIRSVSSFVCLLFSFLYFDPAPRISLQVVLFSKGIVIVIIALDEHLLVVLLRDGDDACFALVQSGPGA